MHPLNIVCLNIEIRITLKIQSWTKWLRKIGKLVQFSLLVSTFWYIPPRPPSQTMLNYPKIHAWIPDSRKHTTLVGGEGGGYEKLDHIAIQI